MGARAEISRRMLNAASLAQKVGTVSTGPRLGSGLVAGLSLIAVPVVAAGLYLATGSPGAPDQPFAAREPAQQVATQTGRPSQAQAEAATPARPPALGDPEYVDLIARLEQRLATRENDIAGLRLLAQGYMRLERFRDAWPVYQRLIGVLGAEAEAELHASMAEAMVLSAEGYVSPEAERALGEALSRNPNLQVARFYAGVSLAQNNMILQAIDVWEKLQAETDADTPWRPWLDNMLARAQEMRDRGLAQAGPTQEQIAAAEDLSPEERDAVVNSMVQGLEERLLTEGGTAQKWNQLINSYMFLGRRDDAERIAGIARERLSGGALQTVETELARLGLSDSAAPGPTEEDISAARDLAPEERQEMIRAMVDRLAERLESEGGSAEEWYRLMNSNVVLGEMDRAREVFAKSQQALQGQDAGFVREQALLLGVITQ